MTNYQRYQPYRRSYRSAGRRWSVLGWGVAAVVVVILIWNGLTGGPASPDENSEVQITLANANGNANGNVNAAAAEPGVREITSADCRQAISTADTDQPRVALTLDASGIAGDAEQLVGVLTSNDIPATVFAAGPFAEQQAGILKAYSDAGIDVLNRGYARSSYVGMTSDAIEADIAKADDAIQAATGKRTAPYFRPPFGGVNATVTAAVKAAGYCPILWTVDTLDVADGSTVANSVSRATSALKNGAIILMHVNSDIALELAPALAQKIKDEGYTLVTIRDLLRTEPGQTTQNANANRSN